MTDRELIEKLHTDPEAGMALAIELYGGLVCAVARGRLAGSGYGEADVEDCAADAFGELYMSLDGLDAAKGSVKGWLCAVARHNALDLLRRRRDVPLEEAEDARSAAPEADFERKEQRRELIEAVRELGEPDREIIIRKYYLAQPSARIARELSLTVSNVDTRAHRAVRRLRERFGGDNS